MLKDVVSVTLLEEYHLLLAFEDGVSGRVDIAELISFNGVFRPLRDPAYFGLVKVDPDLGTVCWPDGADIDPDVLYAAVTGEPLPEPEAISHR